jgi:hypothetical protein
MADTPLPDLIVYGRPDCGLCLETRAMIAALLAERERAGLPTPALVERDIDTDAGWHRAFFASIPVVELEGRRIETFVSLGALRRLLGEVLDAQPTSA